jgi:putative ABC transport system ATP-binding protein
MPDAPLLSAEGLGYSLPDGRVLFRDVELALAEGGFHLLKGPSGAGKSTLLRLLCRLILPDRGVIRLRGRDAAAMDPAHYRTKVLYLHQTPIMAQGSVADNILLPFAFKANAGARRPAREEMQELLREFQMEEVGLEAPADRLSVGQKQRVCLMRGLSLNPEALLLDEPTSALDPENAAIVLDRVAWLNRERGRTVALVTHQEADVASVATRVLRVRNQAVEAQ